MYFVSLKLISCKDLLKGKMASWCFFNNQEIALGSKLGSGSKNVWDMGSKLGSGSTSKSSGSIQFWKFKLGPTPRDTPLMVAITHGHFEFLNYLYKSGASMTERNFDGLDPLEVALKQRDKGLSFRVVVMTMSSLFWFWMFCFEQEDKQLIRFHN